MRAKINRKPQSKHKAMLRSVGGGNVKAELVMTEVENPYFQRDHPVGPTNPKSITVPVNIRESAISVLASKGAINEAQAAAAVQFRSLYETMGGAGARSINWLNEVVDGGKARLDIGERQMAAGLSLKSARMALVKTHGEYAWKLIGYICGEGRSVHELTTTRRQRDTMTDNLRMYLDCLAELWGYTTGAQQRRGFVQK